MIGVVAAVLTRPALWPTALRQLRRTTPRGWWKHRPFVPMPSPDYLRFRLVTQYGETDRSPDRADVLNYLTWCRNHDRALR